MIKANKELSFYYLLETTILIAGDIVRQQS